MWVYDAERGAPTRVTFDGGAFPPLVARQQAPRRCCTLKRSSTQTAAENAGSHCGRREDAVSHVVGVRSERADVPAGDAPLEPTASGLFRCMASAKPHLFIESRFQLWHPDLSPDGRWMAYMSNESGTPEVYVQPYPGPGEEIRISPAGGMDPIWGCQGARAALPIVCAPTDSSCFS